MPTAMAKDQAHQLIDKMPNNASWDDLIYEIYVREVIEEGLADSSAGKVLGVEELRKQYGLPE